MMAVSVPRSTGRLCLSCDRTAQRQQQQQQQQQGGVRRSSAACMRKSMSPAFHGLKRADGFVQCGVRRDVASIWSSSFARSAESSQRAVGRGRWVMDAATLPVLSFDGAATGSEVTMDLKVASKQTARAVIHRGVITELRNKRRGTASTLTRAEVRGGGRKPYKQKGTGRARRGSTRTPLTRGGGVIFGPKPRDWSVKINRKEKQLGISTAIQSAAPNALVVEDFDEQFADQRPKTKNFIAFLNRLGIASGDHALVMTTTMNENVYKSSRNLKNLKLITPRTLTVYDILRADKVVFTKSAVEYLNNRYGEENFGKLSETEDEGEEEGEEEGENNEGAE
ncbi:hypothetical protein CBR_g17149 [Chara braunii]|uniref:Large ribosomal subunit protein uL4c n=1 Tax=Chara braunii TaxID=69332 RepID=A0A388KUT3_CHABU|nr:hypothetical protein CBR_g17149 [Chara braunii]|eukprot:GBG73811.1 hypothetical protein CBR_g17149 [Chara braunii]